MPLADVQLLLGLARAEADDPGFRVSPTNECVETVAERFIGILSIVRVTLNIQKKAETVHFKGMCV